MDSGNSSGSMESSSGGEDQEEYNSRAVLGSSSIPISAFFNNSTTNPLLSLPSHIGPISNPPPNLLHQHLPSSSSSSSPPILDSFSIPPPNHLTNPTPPLLNFDMSWSKNLRSGPNSADLGGLGFVSSPILNITSPTTTSNEVWLNSSGVVSRTEGLDLTKTAFPSLQGSVSEPNNDNNNNNNNNNNNKNVVPINNNSRNPKKRTRASRRAPTTVLTTDTTNFRAMVQEFTGIPSPPFTSSPFPRTSRFDLFGATSQLLTPPPPYLLRPFPQKIHQNPPFLSSPPPPPPSSSLVDAIVSSTKVNQQQPNPVNNFSSLLNSSSSQLKVGALENITLGHGHMSTSQLDDPLQNFIAPLPSSSETTATLRRNDRPINLSSVSFNGDKGTQSNVGLGTRNSEGMVESWICSSD